MKLFYKVPHADWMVSWSSTSKGKGRVTAKFFMTKKEALIYAKSKKGYCQLFHVKPELRKLITVK